MSKIRKKRFSEILRNLIWNSCVEIFVFRIRNKFLIYERKFIIYESICVFVPFIQKVVKQSASKNQ